MLKHPIMGKVYEVTWTAALENFCDASEREGEAAVAGTWEGRFVNCLLEWPCNV
jgi:hypothetical protein